jgi:two-component system, chemotaxis family, chemotaxis protein CheY
MSKISKILLVDDEAHVRKYISLLVKGALGDVELFEAGNSTEALALYREQKPDLVMLDINMPGRDGLETLQDLTELDPDVVVIMLTSVSARNSVEKAIANGASGYILKDTPAAEIRQTLTDFVAELFSEETSAD